MAATPLTTLVVDDEAPIVDELVYLLSRDDRIGEILTAHSGPDALRVLESHDIDLLFLDIAMPALSGLDLAKVVARFRQPPKVVFVTAHDDHAVEAFELNAVDYLLKPVRAERLSESVRRALESGGTEAKEDVSIPVELGGVTRFVSRSLVTHAEAQGDYVRLHTADGTNHLIRSSLTQLESDWSDAGFVRIHRSLLVAIAHVDQVRAEHGRYTVIVPSGEGQRELAVSRRYGRALRERIQDLGP